MFSRYGKDQGFFHGDHVMHHAIRDLSSTRLIALLVHAHANMLAISHIFAPACLRCEMQFDKNSRSRLVRGSVPAIDHVSLKLFTRRWQLVATKLKMYCSTVVAHALRETTAHVAENAMTGFKQLRAAQITMPTSRRRSM